MAPVSARDTLLDYDPLTQIRTDYHEIDDRHVGFETRQDVTDIIEVNKTFMADVDERHRYGDMSRVASIPVSVFFELERTGISRDPVAFKRWLDDPDNRLFRTRPGRLSK